MLGVVLVVVGVAGDVLLVAVAAAPFLPLLSPASVGAATSLDPALTTEGTRGGASSGREGALRGRTLREAELWVRRGGVAVAGESSKVGGGGFLEGGFRRDAARSSRALCCDG